MKTLKLLLLVFLTSIISSSFASGTLNPVGSMKSREHIITIFNGPTGSRYSVSSLDGQPIAENLSKDDLISLHPEMKETIERGIADSAWVGINPPYLKNIEATTRALEENKRRATNIIDSVSSEE